MSLGQSIQSVTCRDSDIAASKPPTTVGTIISLALSDLARVITIIITPNRVALLMDCGGGNSTSRVMSSGCWKNADSLGMSFGPRRSRRLWKWPPVKTQRRSCPALNQSRRLRLVTKVRPKSFLNRADRFFPARGVISNLVTRDLADAEIF